MENQSKAPAPFSFATVQGFDNHIESSIPGFANLVDMVAALASYYIEPGARVYDWGCSTGALLVRLNRQYPELRLDLVGIDCERNLLGAAVQEWPLVDLSNIQFIEADLLETDKDFEPSALITAIFTLQFLPIHARQGLAVMAYEALRPGGAFIVAEKIHQDAGAVQEQFTFTGYDFKRRSFSAEEVLSKQADLRHIMRPMTEAYNVAMLHTAGFKTVVPFWQGLNFKAWLCVK